MSTSIGAIMTPAEFLDNVAKPNVKRAKRAYWSRRATFNAVLAVDALAAHIFHSLPSLRTTKVTDDDRYRDYLAGRNDDYRLLREIAKAERHVALRKAVPIAGAAQIATVGTSWGGSSWGNGRWGNGNKLPVVVSAGTDDIRDVAAICERALDFLTSEMLALKIVLTPHGDDTD